MNEGIELYTNSDNETESPKQAWYYRQFQLLPPPLRTVKNLHEALKEKERTENLPFKLVCEKTLYNYSNRFDWSKRVFKSVGEDIKKQHMIYSDYLFNELWEDTFNLHAESRKLLEQIDWTDINLNDSTEIRNLCLMTSRYIKLFETLTAQPLSLANMFAMIKVLVETEEEQVDRFEEAINSLLYVEDPK